MSEVAHIRLSLSSNRWISRGHIRLLSDILMSLDLVSVRRGPSHQKVHQSNLREGRRKRRVLEHNESYANKNESVLFRWGRAALNRYRIAFWYPRAQLRSLGVMYDGSPPRRHIVIHIAFDSEENIRQNSTVKRRQKHTTVGIR